MGILTNRVSAGDYKDADVKLKDFGKKLILFKSGVFKDLKIELNRKSVKKVELIDKSQSMFDFVGTQTAQVAIYFQNGKKSLVTMSTDYYQKLNELLF